jgi:GT2 family glycosyltransferase
VPEATIAIVTRNRSEELRSALKSAVMQRGSVEVLVLDDASDDGTPEMVTREFSDVRLVTFDVRAGLVVRRNDAARLACAPVIVSIDDDAVFTSSDCVVDTLRDFGDPRVAAVAVPYRETLHGRQGDYQLAPDQSATWVAATFDGCAYAVRRDVFLAVGGFREQIVHQGEEMDYCLRLLAAGYVVRLGRSRPIHHRPSPTRDLDRMDTYGRRNELLFAFTYFPWPLALGLMVRYAAQGIVLGLRLGRPYAMVRGIGHGLRACWQLRGERRPVSWSDASLYLRLRREKAARLESLPARVLASDGLEPRAMSPMGKCR